METFSAVDAFVVVARFTREGAPDAMRQILDARPSLPVVSAEEREAAEQTLTGLATKAVGPKRKGPVGPPPPKVKRSAPDRAIDCKALDGKGVSSGAG